MSYGHALRSIFVVTAEITVSGDLASWLWLVAPDVTHFQSAGLIPAIAICPVVLRAMSFFFFHPRGKKQGGNKPFIKKILPLYAGNFVPLFRYCVCVRVFFANNIA